MRSTFSSVTTSAERRSSWSSLSSFAALNCSKAFRNSSKAALACGVSALVSSSIVFSDGRDLTAGEQREGHDRYFPKLDFKKRARLRRCVAPGPQGAKADRQAVERAVGDKRAHIAHALDIQVKAAAHQEAAGVFGDGIPHADRLMRR